MHYIIVSNRLPLTIKNESGEISIEESSGGLVTGLSSYLQSLRGTHLKADYLWIGWPGLDVDDKTKTKLQNKIEESYNSCPVFLPEEEMENFYQGFCNKTIWPLFHYFPSFTDYKEEFWQSYYNVNKQFCEIVLSRAKPDDQIWIHDYHLMLLPKMIREKRPELSIGFFLHIPFPTYEIFSLLPSKWRTEILQGILGADVIGFHMHDYTQYFLRCVLRILGKDNEFGKIQIDERTVKADTFPMGIDYKKFSTTSESEACRIEKQKIKANINIEKIILSIDRLDYTKGILNRLFAFENFLERNKNWHKRTKLLLHIIPSRIGVDKYNELKDEIDRHVGRINGKYAAIDWTPISYQYGFISFEPLVALYNTADIMLVTPLRDGMNLIAKEYISSKGDEPGVLILSEMTGASKELGEALIINPNYKEEIASAIETAINMPLEEQRRRNRLMQKRLERYNVVRWAEDFLWTLENIKQPEPDNAVQMNHKIMDNLVKTIISSKQAIIFIEYNGSQTAPSQSFIQILQKLTAMPNLEIALITGSKKEDLEKWFSDFDIYLAAEHGAYIRNKNKIWKLYVQQNDLWKKELLPILEIYADRLPEAFIEEKDYSLVWHYGKSDPELAVIRKKELIDQLVNLTANKELQIINGRRVVEIKTAGVNSGTTAKKILGRRSFDSITAFSDDTTGEDLFHALPEGSVTVKIGKGRTIARNFLNNYKDVTGFLEMIIKENV